jgi:hypothetical protein
MRHKGGGVLMLIRVIGLMLAYPWGILADK